MNARTEILNYLAHTLRQVSGTSRNDAIAIASIANTTVQSISVPFGGFFYRGATVSLPQVGLVTANAIASISNGSVDSITVDVPGGLYLEFIQLLSELGFVLESQNGDSLGTQQTYIPAIHISGDGSGANAYPVINAAGAVSSVIVDAPGSGYSTPPTIVFETPSDPIPAAQAIAEVRRGIVERVVVTHTSHSYTFIPNVSVSASSLSFNTTPAQVHRSYRYLDDINDFPTIMLGGTPSSDYFHYGAGQQLKTVRQFIRGYVYSSTTDSIADSENLARDIESVVNEFPYLASNLSVYDARVTAITTDEGLLSPYGLCDLQVEILYHDSTN